MSLAERIKQKREALRISKSELASRVGVSSAAISQYESGQRNPSHSVLLKLANALNVAVDQLSDRAHGIDNIEDSRLQVIAKSWPLMPEQKRRQLFDQFQAMLNPSISGLTGAETIYSSPAQYARNIMEANDYRDLPVDVEKLCVRLSVSIVSKCAIQEHEAMLVRTEGGATLFVSEQAKYQTRRRFTIAHALGHLIIPWHLQIVYQCRSGNGSFIEENPQEIEANEFAAELLMPEPHVRNDVPGLTNLDLSALLELAHSKYEVSFSALLHRVVLLYGRAAIVTAEKGAIKYDVSPSFPRAITNCLLESSLAYRFCSGQHEEIVEDLRTHTKCLSGRVPASAWIKDVSEDERLLEKTIYMTEFDRTISLLIQQP